jgi:hypothetical protein
VRPPVETDRGAQLIVQRPAPLPAPLAAALVGDPLEALDLVLAALAAGRVKKVKDETVVHRVLLLSSGSVDNTVATPAGSARIR